MDAKQLGHTPEESSYTQLSDTISHTESDSSQLTAHDSASDSSNDTMGTSVQEDNIVEKHSIYVPDLFSSIMAVRPTVNPHYHDVKPKADSWIARIIHADEKWAGRNSKVDLCFLASTWAPYCDEEALQMMVDWNHWVFLFDDQFDEGHLSRDPVAAFDEIEKTLAIMEDSGPPVLVHENPIRYVFQTTWDRLKKRASPDLQNRWKEMHRRFFNGLLNQVRAMHEQRVLTRNVEEYMEMRRGTIGAYPAIVLTEYALGIELSQSVFDHPSLQECMCVSSDLVLLVNDILSYKKDLALGVEHNLVTLLAKQGLSTQEAVDKMGSMINGCYKRWYTALADMPVWGENIDRQVLKFVDACRNVALGNLYWSFKTGRYLGMEGEQVHETRIMSLL